MKRDSFRIVLLEFVFIAPSVSFLYEESNEMIERTFSYIFINTFYKFSKTSINLQHFPRFSHPCSSLLRKRIIDEQNHR